MSEQRLKFVHKNISANAYNDYLGIKQPLLILLGDEDLNVDVEDTRQQLLKAFSGKNNLSLATLPKATHGLLKSQHFSEQIPGLWFWLKLMWMQENAFVDELFPTLINWLTRIHSCHTPNTVCQHCEGPSSCADAAL